MLVTELAQLAVGRSGSAERAGLFGPSCEAIAKLAAVELNREAGLLGRPVELVVGGASPAMIAQHVDRLVTL